MPTKLFIITLHLHYITKQMHSTHTRREKPGHQFFLEEHKASWDFLPRSVSIRHSLNFLSGVLEEELRRQETGYKVIHHLKLFFPSMHCSIFKTEWLNSKVRWFHEMIGCTVMWRSSGSDRFNLSYSSPFFFLQSF